MAAACNGRADIGVGMLNGFLRGGAEQLFQQICTAGNVEFFGEDAQRVLRRDKMHAGDARVGFQCAQQFAAKENKIGFARQFYNDQVMQYNTRIQSVPTNVIAGMFHFEPMDLFELKAEEERAVPVVKF